jgi:hypothetical protein
MESSSCREIHPDILFYPSNDAHRRGRHMPGWVRVGVTKKCCDRAHAGQPPTATSAEERDTISRRLRRKRERKLASGKRSYRKPAAPCATGFTFYMWRQKKNRGETCSLPAPSDVLMRYDLDFSDFAERCDMLDVVPIVFQIDGGTITFNGIAILSLEHDTYAYAIGQVDRRRAQGLPHLVPNDTEYGDDPHQIPEFTLLLQIHDTIHDTLPCVNSIHNTRKYTNCQC